jgi:Xaa-Pro aminopeptidase
VHDVGDYKVGGEWRVLEPGMTLTVEPGIYIRPSPRTPKEFWNIGIRIEDEVLVTPHGPEVLTAALEKTPDAIEALVRSA